MASSIPGLIYDSNSFVIPPYTPSNNNGVAISSTTSDIGNGYEINITLTNQSAVSSFISPTSYLFNLLVPTSTFPKASSTFWVSDNILRRSSTHSSNTSRWALQSMGYPGNVITAPVVVLNYDNNTKAVAVFTNYARNLNFIGDFTNGNYSVSLLTNYQLGTAAPNDWFAPSEARSFKIWVQTAYNPNGITSANIIDMLKPYTDWHKSTYPRYGNSAKSRIKGRLCGYYLAQSEAPTTYNSTSNARKYWAFDPSTKQTVAVDGFSAPNVHPETCSGWEELLDASVPVQTLLSKGYGGIVLWAINGFANDGEDLKPCIFTALPTNLKNTVSQIAKWSRKTGLKVYIYCGYGGYYVQTTPTTFNSSNVAVAPGDRLAASFNINTAQRPTIDTTYDNVLKSNFDDGIFNYVDGVILDASPDIASEPWFATIVARWGPRDKVIAQETYKSDLNSCLSSNAYFTQSTYIGKCPLLEALNPGYQPKVIISNFSDFASNRTNFETRIRAIEESGGVCIILGTDVNSLPNIPSYMIQTGGRRSLGRRRI